MEMDVVDPARSVHARLLKDKHSRPIMSPTRILLPKLRDSLMTEMEWTVKRKVRHRVSGDVASEVRMATTDMVGVVVRVALKNRIV